MKVLYIVPDGDDLGGIYTSTENLLVGFREAGHQATFALLKPTHSAPREHNRPFRQGSYKGIGTGYMLHPQYGWEGSYWSLGDKDSRETLIKLGNHHDLVVWAAMFGLRNKCTEGTTDWLRLFSAIKKPHVCMIRDDHLQDRYPWVAELEKHGVVGWACVQRSSFDSCAGLHRPRAIIYSGHGTTPSRMMDDGDERVVPHQKILPLKSRTCAVFMMHTFKSWKRADRLVAAVPYLKKAVAVLGGVGIEYYYMASETKCKPRYYCAKKSDPDASKAMLDKPIWANALRAKMMHMGNMTARQRDAMLAQARFFVDLSWREHSTGQINRTTVEAIKRGCVPICNSRFITGRDDGKGELFVAGKHFIAAPSQVSTPKQLAAFLDNVVANTTEAQYKKMQEAGMKLIKRFDRKLAAQQLVDLAMGKKTGDDYDRNKKPNAALIKMGHEEFHKVFGVVK